MIILPKTPSKLLEIALNDLVKSEEQGIIIDMSNWGLDIGGEHCSVCFAGAVMMYTTKIEALNITEFAGLSYSPELDLLNEKCYHALDWFRMGRVENFLFVLTGKKYTTLFSDIYNERNEKHVEYKDNPSGFKEYTKGCIEILKSINY